MVISTVNQVIYNGDGINKAWPYTFKIIDATDIKLTIVDADNTETEVTADYFVDTVNNTVYYPGYAPGAEPPEILQPPVLAVGQKLVVYRQIPITQEADLGEVWPFSVIEKALDKLTMILQQVYDWWGRTLKVSAGTSVNDIDTTIPLEAGKVIAGRDDLKGFETRDAIMLTDGAWDAKGYAISNVAGPGSVNDAATKDYVDTIMAGYSGHSDRFVPFDTVAQMKVADLIPSQMALTMGYADINDGRMSVYSIRAKSVSDVEDGIYIIFLDNGNVAEWISQNEYFAYKEVEYPETVSVPVFKSLKEAAYEWEVQKAQDAADDTITVATFNVYGLELGRPAIGYLSNLPLYKQLAVMLMLKAQVVCLNEVYKNTDYDTPNLYNAENKFPYNCFTKSYDSKTYANLAYGYEWGTLTESALSITEQSTALFPSVSDWEDDSYSRIVVNVGGKNVSIYSTHLEYRSTEAGASRRRDQLALLYSLCAADASDYHIIMGDMNTTVLSDFSVFTDEGYKLVNVGQYKTWEDTLALDNIIVSPNITVLDSGKISVTSVPNEFSSAIPKAVSDHSPIWARLQLD